VRKEGSERGRKNKSGGKKEGRKVGGTEVLNEGGGSRKKEGRREGE
jgi:hypothetical protein